MVCGSHDHPSARTPERLVGRGRSKMGEGDGAGMDSGCHQAGDVGNIRQQKGACFLRHLPKGSKIQGSRIGGGPGDDHLRATLPGQLPQMLKIDPFLFPVHPVGKGRKEMAAETLGAPMGEMATVRKIHAQKRIFWLHEGKEVPPY